MLVNNNQSTWAVRRQSVTLENAGNSRTLFILVLLAMTIQDACEKSEPARLPFSTGDGY